MGATGVGESRPTRGIGWRALASLVILITWIVLFLVYEAFWIGPFTDFQSLVLVIASLLTTLGALVILWAARHERGSRRVLKVIAAVTSLLSVAVATAAIVAFSWFDVSLSDGIGDRTYAPATAADTKPSYSLGVGNLRLDLSQLSAPARIKAHVGVGELKVVVPRDAAVTVDAKAKAGDVYVFNHHDDGTNAAVQTGRGALVVDAKVGAGRIDVVRAQ